MRHAAFALFLLACGTSSGNDATDASSPDAPSAADVVAPVDAPADGAVVVTPASCATSGVQYYVSTSGKDSNDGSSSAPWATIAHALGVATAGSTVHVAPGTYSEQLKEKASGTSSARICIISDTKWAAKIVGGCPAIEQDGDYVDVFGFDVTGSCATGIMNNGSHDRVVGNHVHDLPANNGGYAGILVDCCAYTSTDNQILGNSVHDIATALGQSNTIHGIYVADAHATVQNNVVYRAAGWGIQAWHCDSDYVLTNNTIFDNFNGGIIVGGGDECPTSLPNKNSVVSNNIVFHNGTAPSANGNGIEEYGSGTITNATYANNLVFQNQPKDWSLAITKLGTGTGAVAADPQFADASGRLKSTSPAIDKGASANAPGDDFDGIQRPVGKGFDIGAFEWH